MVKLINCYFNLDVFIIFVKIAIISDSSSFNFEISFLFSLNQFSNIYITNNLIHKILLRLY